MMRIDGSYARGFELACLGHSGVGYCAVTTTSPAHNFERTQCYRNFALPCEP